MICLALLLSLSLALAPTASAAPLLALPLASTPTALNQYSAVGSAPQTYDANGNLTSDGSATYTFDAESRLTQVVKGGVTSSFTYDALGRRASKTVSGVTTKFLYDGADLLEETDSAGTVTARYLMGPGIDEPLELKRGTTTSSYSADGLGSIAHLTNASGAIAERYTYETFGKLTIKNAAGTTLSTSALGNRFTFTGREYDSETGLYYYRARYYNPIQGRFLGREPEPTDVNLYRYVFNDPTTWVDPLGLELWRPMPPPANHLPDVIGLGPILGSGGDIVVSPTPEPPTEWMPPNQTPPSRPDVLPEPPSLGGDLPTKKGKESLGGMNQPGINRADPGQGQREEKGEPKKGKKVTKNPDGTTTEIETRGTRGKDGSTSQIVRIRDKNGNTVSVQHVVTDPQGNIIHQHPIPIR